jgi:hypothetical protein
MGSLSECSPFQSHTSNTIPCPLHHPPELRGTLYLTLDIPLLFRFLGVAVCMHQSGGVAINSSFLHLWPLY